MTAIAAKVYANITGVQADLAKEGIAKTRKNTQGSGYQFRGIDDIYNALAPILARNQLCILPRMVGRTVTERAAKAGGTLFTVVVEAEFDVVSAEDGSKHTIRTFGEAFDPGDKATNKAMSAAYKYAAIQLFCIPTEGDNDADASTHEAAGKPAHASGTNGSSANGSGSNGSGSNGTGGHGPGEPGSNGDKKAPLINKKQAEEIQSLCARKGKTIDQVKKRFNVDSLLKLSMSQYGIIKSGFAKLPDAEQGGDDGSSGDEAEV